VAGRWPPCWPLLVAGPTNALPVVNAVAMVLDASWQQRARSAAASDPVGSMVPRTNVVDQEWLGVGLLVGVGQPRRVAF
jgi:hypothetical protein